MTKRRKPPPPAPKTSYDLLWQELRATLEFKRDLLAIKRDVDEAFLRLVGRTR